MSGDDPWFVYLVRCADDSLYCGVAKDVAARVAAHNAGRGARYTRGRGPVTLAYVEEAGAHGDALRRERAIKALPRARKLALAKGAGRSRGSPSGAGHNVLSRPR